MIGHQTSSTNNDHQGDMPYFVFRERINQLSIWYQDGGNGAMFAPELSCSGERNTNYSWPEDGDGYVQNTVRALIQYKDIILLI